MHVSSVGCRYYSAYDSKSPAWTNNLIKQPFCYVVSLLFNSLNPDLQGKKQLFDSWCGWLTSVHPLKAVASLLLTCSLVLLGAYLPLSIYFQVLILIIKSNLKSFETCYSSIY